MSTPMHDLPEHLGMEVDEQGNGPVEGTGIWACWCGREGCDQW